MSSLTTVYYEDQLGRRREFIPHQLVLACVVDRLDAEGIASDRGKLGRLCDPKPMNGDSKLLAALQTDAPRIAHRGPVIAVFDDDRVRTLLGMPGKASQDAVLKTLDARCPGIPSLSLVLLKKNMEDVVTACLKAQGKTVPSRKPTPDQRDEAIEPLLKLGPDKRREVAPLAHLVERLTFWFALMSCAQLPLTSWSYSP